MANANAAKTENIVRALSFTDRSGAKLELSNAFLMLEVCHIFNNVEARTQALSYLERCFCLAVETEGHLHLSFEPFRRLCRSSRLNVTSEVEVLNAAEAWMERDPEERSRFAAELIKTIRLPLLSPTVTKNLLSGKNLFSGCEKCVRHIRSVEEQISIDPASVSLQNRYCDQENFDVLVCGGQGNTETSTVKFSTVYRLGRSDFSEAVALTESERVKIPSKVVVVNRDVYTVTEGERAISISRYSTAANRWYEPHAHPVGNQRVVSACAVAGSVYVSSLTYDPEEMVINHAEQSHVRFDPKSGRFEGRKGMREIRYMSACAVFGGEVAVVGGKHVETGTPRRTVEAYDPWGDAWSAMPDMVYARCPYSSAAVGNKLFVFGGRGGTVEVYDVVSRKFACFELERPPFAATGWYLGEMMAFGGKILVFSTVGLEMAFYDLEGGSWSEVTKVSCGDVREKLQRVHSIYFYSCLKLPHY